MTRLWGELAGHEPAPVGAAEHAQCQQEKLAIMHVRRCARALTITGIAQYFGVSRFSKGEPAEAEKSGVVAEGDTGWERDMRLYCAGARAKVMLPKTHW